MSTAIVRSSMGDELVINFCRVGGKYKLSHNLEQGLTLQDTADRVQYLANRMAKEILGDCRLLVASRDSQSLVPTLSQADEALFVNTLSPLFVEKIQENTGSIWHNLGFNRKWSLELVKEGRPTALFSRAIEGMEEGFRNCLLTNLPKEYVAKGYRNQPHILKTKMEILGRRQTMLLVTQTAS